MPTTMTGAGPRARRRGALVGVLAAIGVAVGILAPVLLTDSLRDGASVEAERITAAAKPVTTPSGDGSCDVDGVDVSYHAVYRSAPVAGYYVGSATVANIAQPSCAGASLSVMLSQSPTDFSTGNQLGSATGPIATGASSVTVSFGPPGPRASLVRGVRATLAGGSLPVPSQCTGMTFTNVFTGTPSNDTLTGTNQDDLMFGEQGDDSYASLSGNDCISAGTGTNTITVGNGSDVIVVTGHPSQINSAPGSGLVTTIAAGNGNNGIYVSHGNAKVSVGNGNNSIRLGDGNDVIYVGNGVNSIDAGGGNNICHIPANKIPNNTIINHSCTAVSP